MNKDELFERLRKEYVISKLIKENVDFSLTGGAITDIYNYKAPKDYDFIHLDEKIIKRSKFLYATKYSRTYNYEGSIFQVLRMGTETFDYTVSQGILISEVAWNTRNMSLMNVDMDSLKTKILKPTAHSLDDKKGAITALARLPHYEKKGFKLPTPSYLSLLRTATESNEINTSLNFLNS